MAAEFRCLDCLAKRTLPSLADAMQAASLHQCVADHSVRAFSWLHDRRRHGLDSGYGR
jgi:hypothetical protein